MGFLFSFALFVLSYTITALTAKKPANTTPPPAAISEFNFPQHEEGTPEPVIFGDVWIEDEMILYYGNLSSQAIRQQSGGGKK
jgi:hypothetical protein